MTNREHQEQFQALIEQHRGILYKISNSYCRNRDDREDLAQEIIVQLWRSFGVFDGRCQFSTWMYRIALNVAISHYRSESHRARHIISAEDQVLNIPDGAETPSEDVQLLYRFIEGLDPLNKAMALLYLDGNSYQTISEILGITETNVATKVSRLKQSIKQAFNPQARA